MAPDKGLTNPAANRPTPGARPLFVMAKPVSAACNLTCNYCYYLHRPGAVRLGRMSRAVLEAFVRDTIAAQAERPELHFAWQGGEPTLAGIDFFRAAVALQERYRPAGMRIVNALQTNGTLLDRAWAGFFSEHRFLIGLSLDGPAHLHDPLRRDADGRGSHARAMRGLECLQRAGVEFNTLSVVHRLNFRQGRAVYRYLRRIGARHMQFIPLVERVGVDGTLCGPLSSGARARLAPWTAPPDGFGRFMCEVFDEWYAQDVGRIFVQHIEEYVTALAQQPAHLCVYSANCSGTPILEANGDLYSCDHYVFPEYRLGNILQTPIDALSRSARQVSFGEKKLGDLPQACSECEFLFACCGGCPKHRYPHGAGGKQNYLCPSYKLFFRYSMGRLLGFARAIS